MHPAKEILLISLKKGDQDFQPGELSKNSPLWTQNLRSTLYSKWLAQQMTFNHTIDPANGVKPTPKVISNKFQAEIIIKCKKKTLEEVKKV